MTATLHVPRTRRAGVALAFGTACVSGVAVFVNSYGVRRVPDASVYTTAKNLVAALALVVAYAVADFRRPVVPATPAARRGAARANRLGLVAVGVVGGGVPFVLFFEGLARAAGPQAAFLHKTLVVWVALLAVPLLGERLRPVHVGAIALLVWGQAQLAGGVGTLRGDGEALIVAATALWSVEVILAKRLLVGVASLTVGAARLGIGSLLLVGWLAATGRVDDLLGLASWQWGWAVLTGGLLAVYVATWFAALARAQAVDVTAALVAGALVTTALDALVRGVAVGAQGLGLLLVAAGAAAVAAHGLGGRPRAVPAPVP